MEHKKDKWSIESIIDMIKDDEIDISPEFQRNYVWDDKRASLLIDSLIRNIPLDPIILHQIDNNRYNLVDGKQRITSIKRFIDNELTLSFKRDDSITDILIGKKKYKDLTSKEQKKLTQITLDVVIITTSSESEIRNFFKRKNVGGVKLTNQEIRSGVSGGNFKSVLKRLQETKRFQDLWGASYNEDSKKQRTDENILKFFSFYEIFTNGRGLDDYGTMKTFLDRHIDFFADERNLDRVKRIEERFLFSTKKCHDIFYSDEVGDDEFRPFSNFSKSFNWTVALAQLLGFSLIYTEADNDSLRKNSDNIRNAMIDLLKEKNEILSARGNDKARINEFFNSWFDTLYSIVKPIKSDRFIENKLALKQQLFNVDKVCKLCNNKILSIKNADLDHIVPYSKGGASVAGNLQITHYNCNRAAGIKEEIEDDDDDEN